MRIAVISDVHGNRLALEAVEASIAMVGVDATINLGDLFAGPLDPVGTADLLIERNYPTVIGNHDRYIADGLRSSSKGPVDAFVSERLRPVHLDYLRSPAGDPRHRRRGVPLPRHSRQPTRSHGSTPGGPTGR